MSSSLSGLSDSLSLIAGIGAIAASAQDWRACLDAIAAACVPGFAAATVIQDATGADDAARLMPGDPGERGRDAIDLRGTSVLVVTAGADRLVLIRPTEQAGPEVVAALGRILEAAADRLDATRPAEPMAGGRAARQPLADATLATAFDLSPLALTITDAVTGKLIEVNAAFCSTSGIAREEAIGKTPVELGLWMNPAERQRGLDDLRAGRPLRDRPATFLTAGGVRDCLISASLVMIDDRSCVLSAVKDVTELKRATDLLLRYRLLAEHTRDILLFMQTDGTIVEANAAASAAYGYPMDELIGKHIADLRAPQSMAELSDQFRTALATGIRFETVHRRRDGSTFPVEVSSRSARAGDELLVLSVIRDIGARRRGEEALRASEQRLRLAIEAAGLTMWESADLRDADAVDASLRTMLATVIPEDRPAVERALALAATEGGELAVEFRELLPDGSLSWRAARGRALAGATGEPARLIGVSYDVTAQRIASDAVSASEARFRALAEAMPQLVWTSDAQGRIEYFNRLWETYTGRPYVELLGDGWTAWVHPDDLPAAIHAWHAALSGRTESLDIELRMRRHDGTYRWFTCRAHPTVDPRTGRTTWYGSCTDIDDLKQAEARRGAIIDGIAHDLKNPLAAIKAQAQMLKRRLEREPGIDVTPQLGMLAATASRMSGLIDEMLDATHLAAGSEIVLNREPANLAELARNAVATYDRTSPKHTLVFASGAGELTGAWDAARLERVLGNLIANAIKYSPEGGTVTIGVGERGDGDRRWAQLLVRDEGIGIPEADLPLVFERRHRGANVGRIGGTGLGLAGVADIVRLHGGTISVESAVGAGSTFTILLPLLPATIDASSG